MGKVFNTFFSRIEIQDLLFFKRNLFLISSCSQKESHSKKPFIASRERSNIESLLRPQKDLTWGSTETLSHIKSILRVQKQASQTLSVKQQNFQASYVFFYSSFTQDSRQRRYLDELCLGGF